MTIGKPNRVTTPKRAVLNGIRTSHGSMPRARGRWRPDVTRNRASTPGRRQTAGLPGGTADGEAVMAGQDGELDMAGTQRVIERAVTETAVEAGDDVILERGLSATFAGRILGALTSAGAIGQPVPSDSEDDLACDGSDGPPRRELTPRERDILCRLIRDALHDQRRADRADLAEIAHVIDPRGEW